LIRNFAEILVIFSVICVISGIIGYYREGLDFFSGLYETGRFFLLNHAFQFNAKINIWLEISRWAAILVFLMVSGAIILKVFEEFWTSLKIRRLNNHIIVCGLNKITLSLVEKFKNNKIIVLAEDTNKYGVELKTKGIDLLVGDLSNKYFLKKAKINKAKRIYIVINNDKKNIKTTQTLSSSLNNRTEPLKCFIIINDFKLKSFLEETDLFKNTSSSLDCIPFNINELGIKYGISHGISNILPSKIEAQPEILIIGLTEKTEIALLNLAQCLTMNRDNFKFTIIEENKEKIRLFKKKCPFLKDFAEIKYLNEIEPGKQYTSVLVCIENQTEAIKNAISIRYFFCINEPNILVFCNESDTINEILKAELTKKKIFTINLFEQIANYVFDLDKNIEEKAKEAHYFRNEIYDMNVKWEELSGHFKQSNRNQILDNYVKAYIAFGKIFNEVDDSSLTKKQEETLAMIEHRRWMIEKYNNGWTFGEKNDNEFKRRDCLIPWQKLSDKQKTLDYDVINLMIKLLNNNT
jgi:Kef-type K+ transport systems, predicted NAD-binding component